MLKICKILVSSMLLAWSMAPMLAAENRGRLNISYDRQTGILTVEADRTPLTQILAQIATQSGVKIIVDPSIEREISISLPEQPLEKALKQIARGLSYTMHYEEVDSRNPTQGDRLVAMKILPQGKQGSGNLVPVSLFDARAGRGSGQGDGDSETGGGRGDRNYPAGHYLDDNREPKQPPFDQEPTLDPVELEAQGITVSPPHQQNPSLIQRNNNLSNETESEIDDTEGEDTPDNEPADQ